MTICTLTDAAKAQIATICKDNNVYAVTLNMKGGGCAGFSYQFDLVKELDKGDLLLEENGAKVLIDEVSIPYLEGSIIDYKNDLIGQSFEIKNPNATSSCGCGTSFSM